MSLKVSSRATRFRLICCCMKVGGRSSEKKAATVTIVVVKCFVSCEIESNCCFASCFLCICHFLKRAICILCCYEPTFFSLQPLQWRFNKLNHETNVRATNSLFFPFHFAGCIENCRRDCPRWMGRKELFLDVLPKMFQKPQQQKTNKETQHQWPNDSGHAPSVATRGIESISIEIHRQGNQHSHIPSLQQKKTTHIN